MRRPASRRFFAACITLCTLVLLTPLKPDTVEAASSETDVAVRSAVTKLPAYVRQVMKRTGVPGVAVAVVYKDKLVYAEGFGVRSIETGGAVTQDTVFQIASISKPLGATGVAAAIGKGYLTWETPAVQLLPGFSLSDPDASQQVTIGDLYAHRSGLPGEFGNDLEEFGFGRQYIFEHAHLEPLAPFRSSYAYSNFGLTAGGVAAANAASKKDWSAFAQDFVFKPLGMSSSSFSNESLAEMKNVAALHQKVNGRWVLGPKRDAEAQAPAGGANSTVTDLARWMRMVLAEGTFEGKRIVAEAPLKQMLSIQANTSKDSDGRVEGYGYGMNVVIDAGGSIFWSHSGAFENGASTAVYLVPELELGIVTLTNGWQIGVPEAINATFENWVRYGKSTQDWLQLIGDILAPYTIPTFMIDGQSKPISPKPAGVMADYVGQYVSDYVGNAKIAVEDRQLVLVLGPKSQTRIRLRHWDGDVFFYNWLNMPEGFYTAVRFGRDDDGILRSFKVDIVNSDLGVFNRLH